MTFPIPIAHPHWGPHFPDAAQQRFHWWRHFPDAASPLASTIGGYGPTPAAVFVLELESGFQVTHSWVTDVENLKGYSGKEQRVEVIDAPKQLYKGTARLAGDDTRAMRARIARYAAGGSAFGLALPYEEMTLVAAASGATVTVSSAELAMCDWKQPGQRVAVADRNGNFVTAVIQSVSGQTVTLDVAPGSAGPMGGAIMPIVPIYLEPEQAFPRYPAPGVEAWTIDARAAIFDFAPLQANLTISGGALAGVTFRAKALGLAGDATSLQVDVTTLGIGITTEMTEDPAPTQSTIVQAANGIATVGDLRATLANSTWITMTGGADANVLTAADSFGPSFLLGGTDAGAVGTGAIVTLYGDVPVWDRGLENESTITDSSHALTDMVDNDGLPISIGTANEPDWGRAVMMTSTARSEWQWLKLFLATVRGRQCVFWLPTFRDDLVWVATPTTTSITIDGPSEGSGDFLAWWPSQRDRLQVRHTDGTVEYTQITAYTNNGDGTLTLTLADAITTSSVEMLSWLERCHWEKDDVVITWTGNQFTLAPIARGVQQ